MKCQKTHFELHSTGRNLGEDGNSLVIPTPHKRSGQGDGEVVWLVWGFFGLIFTEFINLNTPWLPWLLQGGSFLLPGDSGTASRLDPAFPRLFGPCCPSHPGRDLTFPQQSCCESERAWPPWGGWAQKQELCGQHLHLLSNFWMSFLVSISSLSLYWATWHIIKMVRKHLSGEAHEIKSLLGGERPAGAPAPALSSSSSTKPPTAQCKCFGRPKFQATTSWNSCNFSTCFMSKGKSNPAEQHWAV